jgi:hypothetical protein
MSTQDSMRTRPRGKSGAAFDKAYINEVEYHQMALNALDETLVPNAQNAQLKSCSRHAARDRRAPATRQGPAAKPGGSPAAEATPMTGTRGSRPRRSIAAACAALLAGCSRRAVHVVEIRAQFRPCTSSSRATRSCVEPRCRAAQATALDHSASPTIASDSSWRTVLTAPGVHAYTCTLHTNMHADIQTRKS